MSLTVPRILEYYSNDCLFFLPAHLKTVEMCLHRPCLSHKVRARHAYAQKNFALWPPNSTPPGAIKISWHAPASPSVGNVPAETPPSAQFWSGNAIIPAVVPVGHFDVITPTLPG